MQVAAVAAVAAIAAGAPDQAQSLAVPVANWSLSANEDTTEIELEEAPSPRCVMSTAPSGLGLEGAKIDNGGAAGSSPFLQSCLAARKQAFHQAPTKQP